MIKDDRMHILIKNPKIQKAIKCVIEKEGLTHEELMEKYLKLPIDEHERIFNSYNNVKDMAINATESDNKQHIKGMMDIIWTVIILVIKGKLSAKKVWDSIGKDLMNERYKV